VAAGPSTRDLVNDERGVIMVVGVIFSLLLIGCAWFIIGVGNAIAYKENLQNAADSAAFAAAVYDARGMNLLAMVNIIMALTLTMLVVGKFIQIVAVMGHLGTCETAIDVAKKVCLTGIGCPPAIGVAAGVCVYECSQVDKWKSRLRTFDKDLHIALKVMHDAEVGIAVAWPWVAAGKSGNMQAYFKPGAQVTTSFSYSQIPWSLETHVGSLLGNMKSPDATSTKDAPNPADTRYGLPVTTDSYANLCKVVFNDVTTLGGIVPSNPISGMLAGGLDKAGAQWFCDDGTVNWVGIAGTTAVELGPYLIKPEASFVCSFTNIKSAIGSLIGGASLGKKLGAALNAITPLPMSVAPPNDSGGPGGFGGIPASDNDYNPMKIYPKADMGLDYYGVWSTAIGNYDDTINSKRVQIAGQQAQSGNKVVADTPNDVGVSVARAEFYYSPGKGDTKATETSVDPNPDHDVLWNMRWRARLRRYHYFPGAGGQVDAIIDLMNQGFQTIATNIVGGVLKGQSPSDIMKSMIGSEVDVNSQSNTPSPTIFH
jgi:hypothetical protein